MNIFRERWPMVVCLVISLANLAAMIYMVSPDWAWAFSTKPSPAPHTLPFMLLSMVMSSLTSTYVIFWSVKHVKTKKNRETTVDSETR